MLYLVFEVDGNDLVVKPANYLTPFGLVMDTARKIAAEEDVELWEVNMRLSYDRPGGDDD